MTADEFRGFIANFVIVGTIITVLFLFPPDWPHWGFVGFGILLWIVAPIIPYHPKPKPKIEGNENERA